MRIPQNAITVKEFIEELHKLEPETQVIFSAVGEVEYNMKKKDIISHFKLYESINSKSKYYDFVL